jgi:hypothetical protein
LFQNFNFGTSSSIIKEKAMKKLFLIAFIPVLTLFAISCENPVAEESPTNYYPDRKSSIFYAYDNAEPYGPGSSRNYYKVNGVQLWEGQHCAIWVDRTVLVSSQDAREIANEFDNNIQPKITDAFGSYNYLFDPPGSGKIVLLLLDIKDNYGKNGNQAYVGGYFNAGDLLTVILYNGESEYPYGNGAAMLYIDTSPTILPSGQSYSTMAHELQHLINFVNSLEYRSDRQDTWIDEGLSSAAEYIYQGGHDPSDRGRIHHFNTDPYTSISRGNNFFVWGEDRTEGKDVILDEYATVYMFFQWLRLQSGGGNGIYTAIAQSKAWDYKAVTGAANTYLNGGEGEFSDWETLLGAWHQANYLNTSDGSTGYRGDSALKPRVWAISGGRYSLYPGEAVYSIYSNSKPAGSDGISFESMTRTETSNNTQYPSGDTNRLVMFNTIADIYTPNGYYKTDIIKTGNLPGTGETKPPAASIRSVLNGGEPYVIDAQDVRGRQGREGGIPIQGLKIEQ